MTLPFSTQVQELQRAIGVGADGLVSIKEAQDGGTVLGETLQRLYDIHVPKPHNISPPYMVDTYHGDVIDVQTLADNPQVAALMFKATQGLSYVDPLYKGRVLKARTTGKLIASYFFLTGSGSGGDQAKWWFENADWKPGEDVEVDWEPNPSGPNATYDIACEAVEAVKSLVGFRPMIYGSNYLHERVPDSDTTLIKCRLSLAAYNDHPKAPVGWDTIFTHQFTGDGQGPLPHTFPGASNALDISWFMGRTESQLIKEWAK